MSKELKTTSKKNKIFTQNIDIYNSYIIVCLEKDIKVIEKYIKRTCNKECAEKLINVIKEPLKQHIGGNSGFLMYGYDSNVSFLYLDNWQNSFEAIGVFTHELHHYVWNLARQFDMTGEMEGQAYLYSFIFKKIFEKLNNLLLYENENI